MSAGYRTEPRDTHLVFNVYRANKVDVVVFEVSCEVAGLILFTNRYLISPSTVKKIVEFGNDRSKEFNVREDDCIVKSTGGGIKFSGRSRTITVASKNLDVLTQCMSDSKIGIDKI